MVRVTAARRLLPAAIVSVLIVVSLDGHDQWNGDHDYRGGHGYKKLDRTELHDRHAIPEAARLA